MELNHFKYFIKQIISEGDRLQKYDITGNLTTSRKYTSLQLASKIIPLVYIAIYHDGFSKDFAGYIISFLGIFVGLFSSILISLNDKKNSIADRYKNANDIEKEKIKKIRNYHIQFNGLTSYSIYLALVLVILLLLVLLIPNINTDLSNYSSIKKIEELNFTTTLNFLRFLLLISHRYITLNTLITFFVITIYSTTSYFSFLQSDTKSLKLEDD